IVEAVAHGEVAPGRAELLARLVAPPRQRATAERTGPPLPVEVTTGALIEIYFRAPDPASRARQLQAHVISARLHLDASRAIQALEARQSPAAAWWKAMLIYSVIRVADEAGESAARVLEGLLNQDRQCKWLVENFETIVSSVHQGLKRFADETPEESRA